MELNDRVAATITVKDPVQKERGANGNSAWTGGLFCISTNGRRGLVACGTDDRLTDNNEPSDLLRPTTGQAVSFAIGSNSEIPLFSDWERGAFVPQRSNGSAANPGRR